MAEGADRQRKPPAGRKSRQSLPKKSSSCRVSLEKVLGITTASSSALTSDPKSGLVAYPAGCVIVLLHPKKNKQTHIINTSRKPFSAVSFSHDGKHLVTGESGHMPCVRVWEVGGSQVAEVQSHKYGVSCVAFSTNSCYIVSVGYQHDMTVSVWDWRKGSVIASNKVSSRVFAVSFSQDNSYFVTAGNRHVKFWYLDASKERRVNSTVPLIGRSGLLGDHKNSSFSGVACGRGLNASSTYCVTSSGLLCLFNSCRHLEAWINLKTSSASCLAVSEDFIFCGCADGTIRAFSPSNLQYITTLSRPHRLGVDLSQSVQPGPLPASPGAQYPDTLAVTFDPAARLLTCVYDDHSVYVWDVKDVRNTRKVHSAMFHSSCVWSVEVYPELSHLSQACLPPSSFLTCSSDNTIRLWHTDPPTGPRKLYSNDLLRILYLGESEAAGADGKAGIRVLAISPDGKHLAAGDRCGNLRIFGLEFLDELVKIEAHDSEVLCLEFSPTSTGVKLLASASRDRLIHVFDLQKDYSLEQTLNDHSASITAVKFTGKSPELRMVSCGADKSIYFQTAQQTAEGPSFSRSHHVVEKTTLYDMDLDSSRTHVAIACQDRNIRVYDVETGKLKRCLKGSSSDEGALLKVQMDPSGSFFATSCSDKNITIFDYESGECVATLFGHSEIVTCMRFSQDCRHLITVSGDSCVFVWRLDSHMTSTMVRRRGLRPTAPPDTCKQTNIRRETFISGPSSQLVQEEEQEEEEQEEDLGTPSRLDSAHDAQLLQTNGKMPQWFRKMHGQGGASSAVQSGAEARQVRSRWTEQLDPVTICSNFSPSPTKSQEEEEEEKREEEEEGDFHPQSLESLLVEEEEEEEEEDGEEQKEVLQNPGDSRNSYILYPNTTTTDRGFDVEGVTDPLRSTLEVKGQRVEPVWSTQLSPDSACSEGSAGSVEQQHDGADTDSLSQGSSVGSLVLEDDDDRTSLKNHFDTLASSLTEERFDTDLRNLQPPDEKHYLNPRLSISTRFLSRFQDRIRAWPSRAPPPVSLPTRISEESIVSNTSVNAESGSEVASTESTQKENNSSVTPKTVVASAVQQGAPRLGYLGTTASSRAKLSQDPPTSTQDEEKENQTSESQPPIGLVIPAYKSGPDQDQTSSVSLSPWHHEPPISPLCLATPTEVKSQCSSTPTEVMSQCLTTPTEVMSQCLTTPTEVISLGRPRSSISSVDDTLTNQNQTFTLSPTASVTLTTTPTTGDIIPSDIISCSASRQKESPARSETRTWTDPASQRDSFSSDPPTSTSSPLSETNQPPQTGSGEDEDSVSLQQCQQVANELRQAARRAVHLYQQLDSVGCSERRLQMSSVLRGAFDVVRADLRAVLPGGDTPPGRLDDVRMASLLEKYSELLVQMTQNKLNRM